MGEEGKELDYKELSGVHVKAVNNFRINVMLSYVRKKHLSVISHLFLMRNLSAFENIRHINAK